MIKIFLLFIAIFTSNIILAQEKQDTVINGYMFKYEFGKIVLYNVENHKKALEISEDPTARFEERCAYPSDVKPMMKTCADFAYKIFEDSNYLEIIEKKLFRLAFYVNTDADIISLQFFTMSTPKEIEDFGYNKFIELYQKIESTCKFAPYNIPNKAQKKWSTPTLLLVMDIYK